MRVIHDDCRQAVAALEGDSLDACVTDPPYGLSFMGRTWDRADAAAFDPEFWREVYRALKPGAHVVAFSHPRTYHRLACAIEDAGFEIRDMIAWLFGSGFPKSANLGDGRGTALKPALEPVVLARKPIGGNVRDLGPADCGALNIDPCRVPMDEDNPTIKRRKGAVNHLSDRPAADTEREGKLVSRTSPERYRQDRPGEALGRWPANVIHDGSDEVVSAFPAAPGQKGAVTGDEVSRPFATVYGTMDGRRDHPILPRGDAGSAARFFYSAKAGAEDRLGSDHPTVKPVDLMAYLIRLITPPGGTVLDPFAGTGTTGLAALVGGFDCILIEREEAYVADIHRRLTWAKGDGRLTALESARDMDKADGADLPLFVGTP